MKNFAFRVIYLIIILSILSCRQKTNKPFVNNAISTAHPLASLAGKKMFEQNGNAFDAAVAAAFTLSVVEPSMSGIGGRLQAIFKDSSGLIAGIDASTQVPMNYKKMDKKYTYGYKTIGIPGVVAGLTKIHETYGSLPLKKVMEPAINYAEKGYKILPNEAKRQQSVKKLIEEFEGSKSHFLNNDGESFKAGDLVFQKTLAKILKEIAEKGKEGFYNGEIAKKIVEDIQANGGILTLEDLKNYNAMDSNILEGTFNGNRLFALDLPSFGALTIQILQIMDYLKTPFSEEQWAKQFEKVTRFAYSYRNHQENQDSLSKIIDYNQAKIWASQLENEKNRSIKEQANNLIDLRATSDGHTTHLTASDDKGNVISLTQTIGPTMGSKVASKELGFLYAVSLGGYLGEYKPGERSKSFISPVLFTRDGKTQLALGAAGGNKIVTAVTQVSHRFFKQKNNLNTSLMLPRIYPDKDTLWIEDHYEVKNLNADIDPDKYPVKLIDEKAKFGRVHAICFDSITNTWKGSADPDWEGTVEYYVRPD